MLASLAKGIKRKNILIGGIFEEDKLFPDDVIDCSITWDLLSFPKGRALLCLFWECFSVSVNPWQGSKLFFTVLEIMDVDVRHDR